MFNELFVPVLFYILPFLLVIVLPAWLVPIIVKKVARVKDKLPSFSPFTLSLIMGAILGNVFWEFGLYNKIYYEWDRVFLPYTFIGAETPLLDGSGSWIAKGWTVGTLNAIWLALTISIYVLSLIIALLSARKHSHFKSYRRVLVISIIVMSIGSISVPYGIPAVFSLFASKVNLTMNSPQVNMNCTRTTSGPQIIYGAGSYYVSDINGNNLRKFASFDWSGADVQKQLSPDGSMLAYVGNTWNIENSGKRQLWIKCIDTDGYYFIDLPTQKLETTYMQMSGFSWSPDSKKVVLNFEGSLITIDVNSKKIDVLKPNIALRQENIDTSSSDHIDTTDKFKYTVGDALWAPSNIVYYTAFADDVVKLYGFDPATNQDILIKQSHGLISIYSSNSDGSLLILGESQSWSNQDAQSYIFNVSTKEEKAYLIPDQNMSTWVKWSTTPYLYTLDSNTISPSYPAFLVNYQTGKVTNLTDEVIQILNSKGISTDNMLVDVRVGGFVKQGMVVSVSLYQPGQFFYPRLINAVLGYDGSFTSLQDYPGGNDQSKTLRVSPAGVTE